VSTSAVAVVFAAWCARPAIEASAIAGMAARRKRGRNHVGRQVDAIRALFRVGSNTQLASGGTGSGWLSNRRVGRLGPIGYADKGVGMPAQRARRLGQRHQPPPPAPWRRWGLLRRRRVRWRAGMYRPLPGLWCRFRPGRCLAAARGLWSGRRRRVRWRAGMYRPLPGLWCRFRPGRRLAAARGLWSGMAATVCKEIGK
jgi:hypothetical protein